MGHPELLAAPIDEANMGVEKRPEATLQPPADFPQRGDGRAHLVEHLRPLVESRCREQGTPFTFVLSFQEVCGETCC